MLEDMQTSRTGTKDEGILRGVLGSFESHPNEMCRVQDVKMKINDPTALGCWFQAWCFSTSTGDDQSYPINRIVQLTSEKFIHPLTILNVIYITSDNHDKVFPRMRLKHSEPRSGGLGNRTFELSDGGDKTQEAMVSTSLVGAATRTPGATAAVRSKVGTTSMLQFVAAFWCIL